MLYADGIENFRINHKSNDFLQLLGQLVLINFKDQIHNCFLYDDENSTKNWLLEKEVPVNSVYVYDKNKYEFSDIWNDK